jgi:hypothetical protein
MEVSQQRWEICYFGFGAMSIAISGRLGANGPLNLFGRFVASAGKDGYDEFWKNRRPR